MANLRVHAKIDALHLPSWMLIIGYPVYWVEVYILRNLAGGHGHTTCLASVLFIAICFFYLERSLCSMVCVGKRLKEFFCDTDLFSRCVIYICAAFGVAILAISLYAALFPPHLAQEFDALNYHYTLPRQHIITGSFAHLTWSSADLYLLPVQFSLAPYWFATEFPNKIPQFIFLVGLLGMVFRLTSRFSKRGALLVVFAILGSHGFGIQMGTAMLDIVLCYLFFAAIDSFLNKKYFLASCEFSFYFWAKPFFPLQNTFIILGLIALYFGFKKLKFDVVNNDDKEIYRGIKRSSIYFLIVSIFVAGPFILKSLYYAGTPIYPIFPGMFKSASLNLHPFIENADLNIPKKIGYIGVPA